MQSDTGARGLRGTLHRKFRPYTCLMPHDGFPGYDDPVNGDLDHDELLTALKGAGPLVVAKPEAEEETEG